MDFFISHSGLCAILVGFGMDLLWGDPRWIPHPVVLIGKLISTLERILRRVLPATKNGERLAGGLLWLLTAAASTAAPWLILRDRKSVV